MSFLTKLLTKIYNDDSNYIKFKSVRQDTTPDIIYPVYFSRKDLNVIHPYISKIAIVQEKNHKIFGPSEAKSIYSYLEEKGISYDFEKRKELALKYCNMQYKGRGYENEILLEALKKYTNGEDCYFKYYMYTENEVWEPLQSCPVRFSESDILVFRHINQAKYDHFHVCGKHIDKYEIIYTIYDDSYWVNLSEDGDDDLIFGFIGTKEKLGTLFSSIVEMYTDVDKDIFPYMGGGKTKIIGYHLQSIASEQYILFYSDNCTYNKCNTITISREEIYNG